MFFRAAAPIMISGDSRCLKSYPGILFVASKPIVLPLAYRLSAKRLSLCESVSLLLFFCGSCSRCRSHRRRCGRGNRERGGCVMPMAVLGGPYFSWWRFAGWLRGRFELLLGRHGRHRQGLRGRCAARDGSSRGSGLLRCNLRLGKIISPCRSDDPTADSGERDYQTERRRFL